MLCVPPFRCYTSKIFEESYPRLALAHWAAECLCVRWAGDLSMRLPWMHALHACWLSLRLAANLPATLLGQGLVLFYRSSFCFHFNVTVKILSDNLNKVIILRHKSACLPLLPPPSYIESNICNIIQNCYSIKMIKWQWFYYMSDFPGTEMPFTADKNNKHIIHQHIREQSCDFGNQL